MLTKKMINALEYVGFKRWQKDDKDRLYINPEKLGLELSRYKTGNVSSAWLDGERISNAKGRKLDSAKTYIDVVTGELHGTNDVLKEKAQSIYERVKNVISAKEEMNATNADAAVLAQAVRDAVSSYAEAAERLCAAAGLQDEWDDASRGELKDVVVKAAEILGVDLRVYKDKFPALEVIKAERKIKMKYQVECATRNEAQIAGREPYDPNLTHDYFGDYIVADSPAKAIEYVMDWMVDNAEGMELEERTEDCLTFRCDTGERAEFFGFTAKVVG